MSTLERLGLPVEIGILIFTIGLVCALAPYFGGSDFGVLKVPDFGPAKRRLLRRYGWIPLVAAIVLFLPFWPARVAPNAAGPFDVRIQFHGRGTALDCARLAQGTATLRIDAESYKAPIDARCAAHVADIPAQLRNHDARVELSGAPAFVVITQGAQAVSGGQTLTIVLEESAMAPRLRIALLPYQVPDPASQSRFQEFREALANKIFNMSQAFSARGAAFTYIDGLKVLNDGPPMASAAELRAFWDESHALQLVRGQVDAGARPTVVHSLVFLGDLAPAPAHAGLQLEMTVTPEAFARNQDSFSLVMLYSLARDAQRLRLPNDVVAAFLSEAYAIGRQLHDAGGDLAPVTAAVDTMLRQLGGAGATP
jgi:hypothetical protein